MQRQFAPRSSVRRTALVALLVASGCPSLSNLHTARPVNAGETELALAGGAYTFRGDDDGAEPEGRLPFMELASRRGFGERFDAGVRLTSATMLGFDLNYALFLGDRVAVSVDPGASFLFGGIAISYLWLPLLVDLDLTPDVTLTLTARLGHAFVDALDDDDGVGLSQDTGLWGLGAGLRFELGDGWALAPEVHVVTPDDEDLTDGALTGITLAIVR